MHNAKYKLELKFIHLETVLNLFPLEVPQKCQLCQLCVLRETRMSLNLLCKIDVQNMSGVH